jgi:hypothetical protein
MLGGRVIGCSSPSQSLEVCAFVRLELEMRRKIMIKRSYLFALVLALFYVTVATAQHPVLDAVANKVVAKYQSSSCEQLMQQKAQKKPPSAGEQKAMEMLRTDVTMRHEFVTIVADQVVDKLIQCGMIP